MKIITKIIAASCALMLLFGMSNVNLTKAAAKDQATENRESFEANLMEQAQTSEKAKQELEKYNALSENEKKKFIDVLFGQEFVQALKKLGDLENERVANMNKDEKKAKKSLEAKNIKFEKKNNKKIYSAELPNDVEVYVEEDSNPQEDNLGMNTLMYSAAATLTAGSKGITHQVRISGVFITEYHLTIYFKYKAGGYVTETTSINNTHWNVNPSIIVSDGKNDKWPENGWAKGWGNYNVHVTGSLGFYSFTHTLNIKADPYTASGTIQ